MNEFEKNGQKNPYNDDYTSDSYINLIYFFAESLKINTSINYVKFGGYTLDINTYKNSAVINDKRDDFKDITGYWYDRTSNYILNYFKLLL